MDKNRKDMSEDDIFTDEMNEIAKTAFGFDEGKVYTVENCIILRIIFGILKWGIIGGIMFIFLLCMGVI